MAKKKALTRIGPVQKILILFLLVVLASVAYYMLFYSDKASELENLKKSFNSLVLDQQSWEMRQKTYIQDVENLNLRKERAREQIRILPPDAEMSSFLMDLDNLAGLAGLEIDLLEPQDELAAGFYSKIPVTMALSGKFHQILKFFYSIGKLERIINIENIHFDQVEVNGTEVEIKAEVQATTFRALEQPADMGAGPKLTGPGPAPPKEESAMGGI
jgi:type IV pilus assembly protein PilO